jgi:hypothetical protein
MVLVGATFGADHDLARRTRGRGIHRELAAHRQALA